MKQSMAIFHRMRRATAYGASMIVATLLALSLLVSPAAQADASGAKILLTTIGRSQIPCNLLKGNPFLGPEAVYAGVWKNLRQGYAASGFTYEEALGVTGLSIITYCPQHLPMAPSPDGIAYGPWVLVPVSSPEQPLLLAYNKGQQGCAIARSQGVDAAVRTLGIPDPDRQAYGGVGINEAKMAMVVLGATLCADIMPAVRGYLGG